MLCTMRSFLNRVILISIFCFGLLFSKPLNPIFGFQSYSGFVTDAFHIKQEKQCLMAGLWKEARGESAEGIKAVLSVIINRKEHPKYPSTFCKVILQDKQFSFANGLQVEDALRIQHNPSEKDKLRLITDLTEKAIQGNFKKTLDDPDVLYYHTHKVKPKWSRKMKKVAEVGNHRFFKLKEKRDES